VTSGLANEQHLVRRLQQGDGRAFEEFLDLYGARVHRLVRRYVANPTDADDVTQEIFIDLYRSVRQFRGKSALYTWVYRVAVNHCLKCRQRAKPENLPLDEVMRYRSDKQDWASDPHIAAARTELADQVTGALNQLSPLHRDVVILHELHGLTYQECAELLEVPVGTVKSRLSNAFRRMREMLGGYVLPPAADLAGEAVGEGTL
jgi:RNA polymerase sigma-70 factor, ECF subfamily